MSSPTTNVDERTQLLASPSNDATTISTVDPKSPVLLAVDAEAGAIYGTVTNDNEIKPPLRSVAGIIAVLLLGVFLANADSSLLIATSATIASEFQELTRASWLLTSYALATCAAQPLYGKLSDIYGRKPVLLVAYTLFAIGCALCGLGTSMSQVLSGRVVSGLGGAGMTSLVSILITDLVPVREIASWRSYVNIAGTMGRGLGAPIGGLLADLVGWRWSFTGQALLTLISILLCTVFLPHVTPLASLFSSSSSEETAQNKRSNLFRIDFLGAGLLASSIIAGLLALDLGGSKLPWLHPTIVALFSTCLILGILFLFVEAYYATDPVFPLHILRKRDIGVAYWVISLSFAAQFAMAFTVPLYFQVTIGASRTDAGSRMIPAVAGNAVGGLVAGWAIKKNGRYKALTLASALSMSLTYIYQILFWRGKTTLLESSLSVIPSGVGTGIAGATVFVALAAVTQPEHMATVTSGFYLVTNVATVLGISGVGAVLEGTLRGVLWRDLGGLEGGAQIIEKAISDVDYVRTLKGDIARIVIHAYVQAIEYAHVVSLASVVLGFVLALFIREHKL